MRKAKLLVPLSLMVAMLAVMTMPLVVSAVEMNVKPEGLFDLIPNSYVPTTVYLSEMRCDGTERTLDVSVKGGTPTELTFKIDGDTNVGGIEYSYTPSSGTKTYDIKVEIQAASGTEGNDYILFYKDVQSGISDRASASVRATSIPEFTTIMAPIAAILGLLFFFNRRKQNRGKEK
jgi:hypothetical protein